MNSSRKLLFKKIIPRIPINKIIKKSASSMGNTFRYKNSFSPSLKETYDTNSSTINLMYKKGKNFDYSNLGHLGSHRSHLGFLEDLVKEKDKENFNHKKIFIKLKNDCNNLNHEFENNIQKLKNDINENIDNLELKFKFEVNKQRIQTEHLKYQMKELKQLMWDNQSLLTQLRTRIKSLKYNMDGKKMFSIENNSNNSYIIF